MKLKSWSPFFQAIKAGEKTHDLRFKGDRTFRVGDVVTLKEYNPFTGLYSGDELDVEITYITDDVTPCAFSSAILPKDYCILSLRAVNSGRAARKPDDRVFENLRGEAFFGNLCSASEARKP